MLLARISENAPAAPPPPPPAVPVEPSREEVLSDWVYGANRRERPPFSAATVMADMAAEYAARQGQ